MVLFFRALLVIHRWLGVTLCVLFLLWYPSGIGMMYWGMPSVTARDRLARWPALDPAKVVLSPLEAAERIGLDPLPPPTQVRLNSFDGRPVYRFGGGGPESDGARIVYADTGEEQAGAASLLMRQRAVTAWMGLPTSDAVVEPVTEPNQWTVGNRLRTLRPLWRYSWPNGEDVYIGESGEVLLHTTRLSRFQAYISAVPHWLYFTPLRANQPFWIRFATYTAMVGTVGAIIGVVLGMWLYSPSKRKYRYAGAPSSIPYKGQKRWHTILGLIFGVATVTWTLSGSLAFLPFPAPQRAPVQARPGQELTQGQGRARGQGRPAQAPRGRRGGDGGGLAAALRGRAELADFAALHPRDLLAKLPDPAVKELELTSFDGQPLYVASLGDGTRRLLSLEGKPVDGFDRDRIIEIVRESVPNPESVHMRVVDQYDYYYFDRTRQRPLPAIMALTNDDVGTRHYIDPTTGTLLGTYSQRNWARRFFYNALHSLSFPWLYNHRPLWDIVVITFMLGGTALCVTALVLAWRAVGRKLRRLAPPPRNAELEPFEA